MRRTRGSTRVDPARVLTVWVLPATGLIILAFGAIRMWLEDRGAITSDQGVVLMAAFAFATVAVLILWSAQAIRRASTERRRADAMAMYRDFAHNVVDASVFIFDEELRYVAAESPLLERTEGLKPSEMIGRTLREVIPSDTAAVIEPAYRAALAGHSTMLETQFQGEHYWVHALPLQEDGSILGGIVITQRITERKRLESDLLQAQKMDAVGRLAGGVAHDFNNLLTAISGFAELLERRLGDDAYLIEIRRASKRAASLTAQLLAFSRQQLVEQHPLDINDVVRDTVTMLARVLGEHVEVVTELAPAPQVVRADQAQLTQVLMNLAINARDAMPSGGRLVIATRSVDIARQWDMPHGVLEVGRYVRLTVSDTGEGIDPDSLPRIFDPFFTTKPVGSGTGLGLSTVYGIATQGGGTVHAYSNPGDGTAFHVYLPVCDGSGEDDIDSSSTIATPPPLEGMRVLLVEDDELVREVVVEMLRQFGCSVDASADGEGALARAQESEYALLITDYRLPRMNGRELATRLAETNPGLKTIYMSGYTGHTVVEDTSLEGLTFLQKPFGSTDLAAKLGAVFQDAA